MQEIEYGLVASFDEVSLSGFLTVIDKNGQGTGETIPFDFNDGQFVEIEGDEVKFIGPVFEGELKL